MPASMLPFRQPHTYKVDELKLLLASNISVRTLNDTREATGSGDHQKKEAGGDATSFQHNRGEDPIPMELYQATLGDLVLEIDRNTILSIPKLDEKIMLTAAIDGHQQEVPQPQMKVQKRTRTVEEAEKLRQLLRGQKKASKSFNDTVILTDPLLQPRNYNRVRNKINNMSRKLNKSK